MNDGDEWSWWMMLMNDADVEPDEWSWWIMLMIDADEWINNFKSTSKYIIVIPICYRDGAFKSLFWVLFDPGHPELVGCKRDIAGTLGLCLWGLYQIINVVVLLNICVALMNNTMMMIESNKENIWKFYRTDAWLLFIDDVNLPIPFNLWSIFINQLYRWAGYEKDQRDLSRKKSKYFFFYDDSIWHLD